MKIDG
ncbi:NodO, partial CDS, partial [Neorhizobium galegae bv. officinalis]